jgi:hypothetical protein
VSNMGEEELKGALEIHTAGMPPDIREAHGHCSNHRSEVLSSSKCGYFYCLAVYFPSAIVKWIDVDESGEGQTAICPRCGIDSVIGDSSGFEVTPSFLKRMKSFWF